VERDAINAIYREAAEGEARGLLKFSEEQNVSVDMLGEDAAVVIEAVETHTRTGFMNLKVPPRTPGEARGLLKFSEEQNVSVDMLGEDAAVVIEAVETHTRTGFMNLKVPPRTPGEAGGDVVRVPLTHVKVFGWYDNEMGSYTYRLGELTIRAAHSM
jgi:glyceraldehyde-3-phosphate dehydrogenase/erythrose-4-phosphate dehydrogenase